MSSLRLAMRASLADMPTPARRTEKKNAGKKRKRTNKRGGGGSGGKSREDKVVVDSHSLMRREDSEEEEKEEDDYKLARRQKRRMKAKQKRKEQQRKQDMEEEEEEEGKESSAEEEEEEDSTESESSRSFSSDSSEESTSEEEEDGRELSSSSSGDSSDDDDDDDDDNHEKKHREDMHGIFDSERSSDEEQEPRASSKKKKKKKKHPKKSFKSHSSQASQATNDSITSHSHKHGRHGGEPHERERKRISSNHSASSSKQSKSSKTSKGSPGKSRSVPPPREEVIAWAFGMSQEKQRRAIAVGMRVKVRFMKPKMKWYGGVVTARSKGGKRIRIKYDDGTKEEPSFPDKEIVIDDEGNGQHSVSVHDFLPTEPRVPLSVSSRIKIERPIEKKHVQENDMKVETSEDKIAITDAKADSKEMSFKKRGRSVSPVPSNQLSEKTIATDNSKETKSPEKASDSVVVSEEPIQTATHILSPENITPESQENNAPVEGEPITKTCASPKQEVLPPILTNRSRSSSPRNITVTANQEKNASTTTLKIRINSKSTEVKRSQSRNALSRENEDIASSRRPQDAEQDVLVSRKVENSESQIVNESHSLKRSHSALVMDKDVETTKSESKAEVVMKDKNINKEATVKEIRSRSQSPSLKKQKKEMQMEDMIDSSSSKDTGVIENISQNQSKEKRKGRLSPQRMESPIASSRNEDSQSQADGQLLDERSSRRLKSKQKTSVKEDINNLDDQKLLKKRRRDKSLSNENRRAKKNTETGNNDDKDVWVQCNRCEKWRLIPSDKNLPDKWYCELNVTDTKRNHCGAAEQTQEEVARKKRKLLKKSKSQSPLTVNSSNKYKASSKHKALANADEGDSSAVKGSKQIDKELIEEPGSFSGDEELSRKRLSREAKPKSEVNTDGENDEVSSDHNAEKIKGANKRGKKSKDDEKGGKRSGKGKKQKEVKDQEWVQCEKCEKWRRLPLHICAKDLPEKWYCNMNDWDPRSASCAVQEDHGTVEQNEDKLLAISSGGNQGGSSSKLSYISLIKKPTRPISERVRAAESLFSSHAGMVDGENSGPPSVMYSNSSAFQQKFRGTDQEADNDRESKLFNFMNQSKLWSVLYQIDPPDLISSSKDHQQSKSPKVHNDNESDEYILKTMIYFVLGSGTFTADEVLLACQVQQWNDDRFTALKAGFTIDIVINLLKLLERSGLVESVPSQSEGVIRMTKYKRSFQIDTNSSKVSKHSKPWKSVVN